jgi:hypothetical protein
VDLSSLDLTNVTRRLPTLLPATLYSLYLDNTLQYEFPTYLADAFPSLQYLYVVVMRSSRVACTLTCLGVVGCLVSRTLSWNYIPSVNSSVKFDALTLLCVRHRCPCHSSRALTLWSCTLLWRTASAGLSKVTTSRVSRRRYPVSIRCTLLVLPPPLWTPLIYHRL